MRLLVEEYKEDAGGKLAPLDHVEVHPQEDELHLEHGGVGVWRSRSMGNRSAAMRGSTGLG